VGVPRIRPCDRDESRRRANDPLGAAAMVAARIVGAVRFWVGIRDGEGTRE